MKMLTTRLIARLILEIDFSDHMQGVFDAQAYLASRTGPLLDKLRDAACPAFFCRCRRVVLAQRTGDFSGQNLRTICSPSCGLSLRPTTLADLFAFEYTREPAQGPQTHTHTKR